MTYSVYKRIINNLFLIVYNYYNYNYNIIINNITIILYYIVTKRFGKTTI